MRMSCLNFKVCSALHDLLISSRFFNGWMVIFLLLFYAPGSVIAQTPEEPSAFNVTIVLSENEGSYAEFGHALDTILSQKKINHQITDTTKPIPASELVIGVGLKAATAAAASNAPVVLNVLITRSLHHKLIKEFPRRAEASSFSTIFLNQPVLRQVQFIRAIFPNKHHVGILYSTPPNELAELRQQLQDHQLVLLEQSVNQTNSLGDALQDILLGRSELILALPDTAVYNESTIRNILMGTYRRGIPLIGLSSGYVNAGAFCAIFSTPEQIARQTAALVVRFGTTHELPSAQYPNEFEVMVNEHVAKALELKIKDSATVHGEIVRAMKEAQ